MTESLVAETLDLEGIVRRIAAFGLPDGPAAPAIEEKDWQQVLARLRDDHVTGLAVAGLESGWLDLTPEQTGDLLEAHRQAMLAPLGVERGLLAVASEFDSGDVEFVVLKGPALAHTVYPDPSWRYFGDLDLLVRADDWHKACAILEDMGFRRAVPEPRGGFDQRFGKAAEFRKQGSLEVDLHRTLVVGPFGLWIEPEALFDGTTQLPLWGRTFRRLDDTLLQLHAFVHASLGWRTPLRVPVRDVAQVAHYAEVDWEALAERAARWKLRAVARHALETASQMLGTGFPVKAQAALAQRPSRKETRALQGYVTSRRNLGGTSTSTLMAIPGIRAKAAFVAAMLFPRREFLSARSGTRPASYLRRWAVPFRWLLRRRRSGG